MKKDIFTYKGQKYYWVGADVYRSDNIQIPEDQASLMRMDTFEEERSRTEISHPFEYNRQDYFWTCEIKETFRVGPGFEQRIDRNIVSEDLRNYKKEIIPEKQALLIWYHATQGRNPLTYQIPKLRGPVSYWNNQSIEDIKKCLIEPFRKFMIFLKVIPDKEIKESLAKQILEYIKKILNPKELTKPLHWEFFKGIQKELEDFLKPPRDLGHQQAFYMMLLAEHGLFTGMDSKAAIIAECENRGLSSPDLVYKQLKTDLHMYKVGTRKGQGKGFVRHYDDAKKNFPAAYAKALKKFKEDNPDI